MKRSTTIALFYCGVALICAAIIGTAMWLRKGLNSNHVQPELVMNTGKEKVQEWFPIERDLSGIKQDGQPIKLSDLRGKVWLVAEFFAICPHCARRNGQELREIYDAFKSHPDFHIACVSVDPENDGLDRLKDYASALGADVSNWWFINAGDAQTTHDYMQNTLKFFGIRERTDPADIAANGRFAHDLAFMLVNRDFQVIGKWPLADAKSEETMARDPQLYQKLKDDLYQRIRAELDRNASTTKVDLPKEP
ncbi:MAG: hypothetical protein EAZ42_12635 [Verrucomicrobia bacterium]|nr:MAG: hypothetical protein EAZ42_12635 [Verrucomicrobiota bacterium]